MFQHQLKFLSLITLLLSLSLLSFNTHARFGDLPTAFLGFSPSVITPGQSTTLTWRANDPSASSCRILDVPELANQTLATSGSITLTPTSNVIATMICGFSLSNVVQATLIVNTPRLDVSFSPSTVQVNQLSTFRWSSSGFSNCTDIAGPLSISGTSGTRVLRSQTVNDVSVTVRCTGSGGASLTRTATLSVVPSGPQLSITAPRTLPGPGLADISWNSNNATSCSSNLLGNLPTSGVRFTFINRDTTVSITCFGAGGSVTRSAFIDVLDSPIGGIPGESGIESLTGSLDESNQIAPSIRRVGDQIQRVDINNDGFEDLIIVNRQTQIGYIVISNLGEVNTINKIVEGISDIRDISSIVVDNLGNVQVEMAVIR